MILLRNTLFGSKRFTQMLSTLSDKNFMKTESLVLSISLTLCPALITSLTGLRKKLKVNYGLIKVYHSYNNFLKNKESQANCKV